MYKILTAFYLGLILSLVVLSGSMKFQKCPPQKVFFNARKHHTNYTGPGREEHPPVDIKEVLIGYFGPSKSSDPEYGDMWSAACMAIEQANKAGGYKGLPFHLVPGWSDNPWGTGISKVVRMAYVDKVWAIIGGIDGPSTHLAEQVAVKARIAVLSPVSSDKTVNLANVPWIFSCVPGDHIQAPVLANSIASHIGKKSFILVSAVDHDSHLFTVELIKSLTKQQLMPSYHLEFNPDENTVKELSEKIINVNAHSLVLIADAHNSAQIIRNVREKNFKGLIFGGPCMGRRSFFEQIEQKTNDLIFPLLYTSRNSSDSFDEKFFHRFGHYPDYLAAHTYDSVNLLITAIRQAGLNRARICDKIRSLPPWQGVTGNIDWDSLGSNSRSIRLETIKNGQIEPLLKIKTNPLIYSQFSNHLQ
jgi:ABC-type branched-subunit amino acid transport system substrate-binding protein